MFQTGYILDERADWVWFLGLPFAAVALALAGGVLLSDLTAQVGVAMALWITIPHYAATFLRTYGFSDEYRRWEKRVLVFPFAIFAVMYLGMGLWPIALIGLVQLWDHQHSLMQQYGFSRIYDLKAGTGAPSTRRFDFYLNWVLFVNLLLTAPLWTGIWVDALQYWQVEISAEAVSAVHAVCWTLTGAYAVVYLGHLVWSVAHGYRLNPLKYLFLGGSYFLWYFLAWQIQGLLMYHIAHRLMHGLQYDVIVYSYVRRKVQRTGLQTGITAAVARPGNLKLFIAMLLGCGLLFNFLIGQGFEDFTFGLFDFSLRYDSLREVLGIQGADSETRFEMFTVTLVYTLAVTHYYFDAFIWKVRDAKTQQGL